MRVPGIDRDPERGQRIRELRRAKRLSQAVLGERIGVSKWTIGNWEKGEPLQYGNLRALVGELETTETFILDGVDGVPVERDGPALLNQFEDWMDARLKPIEGQLQAVANLVSELAAREPLPGQADPRRPGKAEPRRQT